MIAEGRGKQARAKPNTSNSERRSRDQLFVLLVLCTPWFILCWHLSDEWSVNDQYGYGWQRRRTCWPISIFEDSALKFVAESLEKGIAN